MKKKLSLEGQLIFALYGAPEDYEALGLTLEQILPSGYVNAPHLFA